MWEADHFAEMSVELLLVLECLEALEALNELAAFRVLLSDVLLQGVLVSIAFVAEGALRRDLLLVDALRMVEHAEFVEARRDAVGQLTRKRYPTQGRV